MLNALLRQARERVGYLDAALIMAFVLHRSKESILTARDSETLTRAETECFMELVNERALQKPLAYIVGKCEFMGLDFVVNEHTLIPRPDTETVVEAALELIRQTGIKSVLELCTGSGCMAVSLCVLCPAELSVTASDISADALRTAEGNAARHGAGVTFILSDMFSRLDPSQYEMIIANPPYIPHDEIDALPRGVKDYEPRAALDGGPDGLDFYRVIAEKAAGVVVLEIGYNQAGDVKNILERNRFKELRVIKDLAGHDRVITARKNG